MTAAPPSDRTSTPGYSLAGLTRYFLRLGTLGFGGPIALAGHMHQELVVERRWFSEPDYKEALTVAQLAPGPLAAQLAIYLGWLRGGAVGATLVGVAFILPSFFMVCALAHLYVRLGGLSWMQAAFYGVGASVIAIVARSAMKLTKTTLGRDRLLWVLCAANAIVTAITETEIVWLFLLSGVAVLVGRGWRPPALLGALPIEWFVTGLYGPATRDTMWRLVLYFGEAGAFVFGSGLAIVPFLYGGVVDRFHWLSERQFLDAVAVAMITPGPVVITVGFIGWLVAGFGGATAAAFGVFMPCYLFVVVPARYFRRWGTHLGVRSFVDGVTAAATGAIAGAAFVLGRRAIVDVPTALIGVVTFAILTFVKRAPEPLVIVAAGLLGFALRGAAP